jgi:sulfite reductase alpha subunit-like flavoprotein
MIHVIYASQTGNSEAIAKRIGKDLSSKTIANTVESMNKFLPKIEKNNKSSNYVLVIVCSTTGNGDMPENSEKFFRFLKRKINPNDLLSNVIYTVLGLGDSNYSKFQYIPKQVDDLLHKLGAKKFYKRGEADEACGLENVVEPWISNLYPEIEKILSEQNTKLDDKIKIDLDFNTSPRGNENCRENCLFTAKVIEKKALSGELSSQEIYQMRLQISENIERQFMNYSPGSHINILGRNSQVKVTEILKYLLINEKEFENINILNFYQNYPHFVGFSSRKTLSYLDILEFMIDLSGTPKLVYIEKLCSLNMKNQSNLDLLNDLIKNYQKIIVENKVNFYEILISLKPFEITLNDILSSFPILYPRSYSLSSYNKIDKNIIEIIFSFKEETLKRKLPNNYPFAKETKLRGFCSSYLKRSSTNTEIIFSAINNFFKFPSDILSNNIPLLYICNGTGITPFISYLKELHFLLDNNKNLKLPNIRILSGFRSDNKENNETIEEDKILGLIKEINDIQGKEKVSYYKTLSQNAGI